MNNEIRFILYHLPDEEGKVQVVIKDETIWATQKAMAQLFGVGIPAISKHLTHIFDEGELDKEVVVSKMKINTQHGAITHQGLVLVPLIIAKRLNSIRGIRRFTKPSQTDGKKSYCWALLMMA